MSQQSRTRTGVQARPPWWAALWAATIAFTVVVSSGAVLLAARELSQGTQAAPSAKATDRIATVNAPTTAAVPETTRLVTLAARRVVDSRPGRRLGAGATVKVPLPGVARDATAVLLEVSVLDSAAAGPVSLVCAGQTTPVLQVPGKGAQTSATVVVRLGACRDLKARTGAGGDLVITLTGAFEPAATARAGRLLPVAAEQAVHLFPGRDGNRTTIDPAKLSLAGTPRAQVGALLLTFEAEVGTRGGTVQVGRSWNHLDHQVFWAATSSAADRIRRGFLIVPISSSPLRLYYHAGTELTVDVVGLVTGAKAKPESAGLSVPVTPLALPLVKLPDGGRADIALPAATKAKAALVTTAITPKGERTRAVLGLLDVHDGTVRVNGPERAKAVLTPRLLIR
jgi:hypothetical protein